MKRICKIAQRAQRNATGYYCGYTFKVQPVLLVRDPTPPARVAHDRREQLRCGRRGGRRELPRLGAGLVLPVDDVQVAGGVRAVGAGDEEDESPIVLPAQTDNVVVVTAVPVAGSGMRRG